jgi:hypothetical protein
MTLTAQNVSSGEAAPAVELTILMPCLMKQRRWNAASKGTPVFGNNPIAGEIIVADNGSTDRSQRSLPG